MHRFSFSPWSLLLPVALAACSRDSGGGGGDGGAGPSDPGGPRPPISKDGITLRPEAVVLDDAALADVREWSLETGRLVVGPSVKLAVGDVVVGGVGPRTPTGLLRRVTAVSPQGDATVATTTQASLIDVVASGRIDITAGLKKAQPASVEPALEGVTPQDVPAAPPGLTPEGAPALGLQDDEPTDPSIGDQLVLGVKDVVLNDQDGNYKTKDDQLTFSGSVSVQPKLSFVFDPEFSTKVVKEASVSIGIKAGLTYDLHGPFGATVEVPEIPLVTYYFAPIVFVVGPLPLVFVPRFTVVVGAKGKLEVRIALAGTARVEGWAGVGYVDGEFTPILKGTSSHDETQQAFAGNASLKIAAGPDYSVLLYGVAGPKASGRAYVKAEADTKKKPCFALTAGLEAYASLDLSAIELLGIKLGKYQTDPLDVPLPITDGDCDPASQGLNPTASSFGATIGSADQAIRLAATLALPDGGWVLALHLASATVFVKLRPDGTVDWQRGYTSTFNVAGLALAGDGRILVGGKHVLEPWVAKLDLDGNLLWSRTYLPNVSDIHAATRTDKGQFVLVGETQGTGEKYFDDVALAVDDEGTPVWGGSYDDGTALRDVRPAPGGGVVAVGDALVDGSAAAHVMRLGDDGAVTWDHRYSTSISYARSLDVLADGSFAIAGFGLDGASYVRVGANDGHVVAARVLYEPGSYYTRYTFTGVRSTPAGGAYLVGQRDFGADGDALLVAIDKADIVRFASSYGGAGKEDEFGAVLPLADGVLAIGETYSYSDPYGLLVVRTNVTGNADVKGVDRTPLSLAFDPPGSARAGSTPDDLLRPLVDAPFSPQRKPVAFSVNAAGDALEANGVAVTLTPR